MDLEIALSWVLNLLFSDLQPPDAARVLIIAVQQTMSTSPTALQSLNQ